MLDRTFETTVLVDTTVFNRLFDRFGTVSITSQANETIGDRSQTDADAPIERGEYERVERKKRI